MSLDEKPGVQAIENTAPDLPPVPGRSSYVEPGSRIQAPWDAVHPGCRGLAQWRNLRASPPRHRSREYILLLKELDDHYPKDCTIRVILDDHSAHISKETMAYLASRPNRFIYVHTPKHGSWLNLIETCSQEWRAAFLKGIIRARLARGEAQAAHPARCPRDEPRPVVMRWKKFNLGLINS